MGYTDNGIHIGFSVEIQIPVANPRTTEYKSQDREPRI